MPLPKRLRLIANLVVLPGLFALIMSMHTEPEQGTAVRWFSDWWWIIYVPAALAHFALRAVAWGLERRR